jgi:hypothetical protein
MENAALARTFGKLPKAGRLVLFEHMNQDAAAARRAHHSDGKSAGQTRDFLVGSKPILIRNDWIGAAEC